MHPDAHRPARAAGIRRDPARLLVSLRDALTDSDRRIVSDPAAVIRPVLLWHGALDTY